MTQKSMRQKTSRLVLFAFMVSAGAILAQVPTDIGPVVHETVEKFIPGGVAGKKWEAAKNLLGGYDKTVLAHALIAELDIDRGEPMRNKDRDIAVGCFYKQLDLPVPPIVTELAKTQSPYRKYQLVNCISPANSSKVIAAMLPQINDRRVAYHDPDFSNRPFYSEEGGELITPHDLRVCDYAYKIIDQGYAGKLPAIGVETPIETRDKVISETLKKLNLTQ